MSRKVAREVAFKIIFELAFQHEEEASKLFQKLLEDQTVIKAQIVISFPDNDPAYFLIVVTSIHHIGYNNISVLLKGKSSCGVPERVSRRVPPQST